MGQEAHAAASTLKLKLKCINDAMPVKIRSGHLHEWFHMRQGLWNLSHRLKVLLAPPLCIIYDPYPSKALVMLADSNPGRCFMLLSVAWSSRSITFC
jgi:hypothetical protein